MTDTTTSTTTRISARSIAERLGLHPPTPEQTLVIESELGPALVVAGAGSGKTETMAFRVLWLVANGLVAPAQILGLTFTRKAAGELGHRMRDRIAQLRENDLMPERDGDDDPAAELLDSPTVSTYNSFASAIFRDNAPLVGYDGDAVLLGEAATWLLARELVTRSDDLRLADTEKSVDALATAVVRLASQLAENVADADRVEQMAEDFRALADLPTGGRGAYADVVTMTDRIAALPVLLGLARQLQQAKRDRAAIEFSDQVAIALRIVERNPHVVTELRDRYRVVILDEYQDTSVVQTRLLALLFARHPVMAVGDPNQSIYGWRGASAAGLGQFGSWFGSDARFELTTSWRNGERILDAANRLIRPLALTSPVSVAALTARPGADAHPVRLLYPETVVEEADQVAAWFRGGLADPAEWGTDDAGDPQPPSAALILRSRGTLEQFLSAFRRAGVPYHVLGVGGLLAEPLVADLVAALAVVDDPGANSELIRLLLGSRWRLGTADVAALRDLARWLEKRDLRQKPLDDEVARQLRASVADDDSASLIDALDFLVTSAEDHGAVRGFSEEGLARLRDAGETFARLRRRVRFDLDDLVTTVLQELDLDIEAEANDARPGSGRVLEAFFDALAGFQQLGQQNSLRAFLGWLREAESRERLSPRSDPPEPGCVQIVTIHGSKGLEWDLVAVPRLVEGEMPSAARDTGAWVAFGELPYEFRGDASVLPDFRWREATTRKEVLDLFGAFKSEVREQQLLEDRRLAYVAITRARRHLLLSGSFWSSQTKPRRPGAFLRELADDGIVPALPEAPESEENPLVAEPEKADWPRDPLGSRRQRVEAAAELVRTADPADAGRWSRDVELLLEERRQRLRGSDAVTVPERIPASRFKDWVENPARVLAELRRPMPERPYRATRLGTLFHAWVEKRSDPDSAMAGFDDLDALGSELDGGIEGEDLTAVDAARFAELRATFEASPWADRRPIDVEREIHLPLGGRTVVCKIDAVYAEGDGDAIRYEIVDWKTGKAPRDAADRELKQLQLALYRLAYARWRGVDPEHIDAAFYFVADDETLRPERIDDEDALAARWAEAMERIAPST
ncbi:ATP-dependent helicase [Schumannella luteola]|uniref:DNA 3'-5' helicase n=1 Tax=Schumannella luteola TaxID=472059 RepID=A0A852YCE8_9MICO|nr:ATP-dependent DNA helicase [Schumannella luteola]NYG99512.1 DNA helicase-2/ATP-dependent DNA helicase PcrA [Schumannella luteola]TPX03882.1 ATP-dependent helicase [Schumannella luteola]